MSVSSTVNMRSAVVRRAHWLRVLALVLTLLGLGAQQRVLTQAVRPSTSVARLVAQRVESIETHAVRVEPAMRMTAVPVFARVPWASAPVFACPWLGIRACVAPPSADPEGASLSHFHSKRRIPRMNSEEPPRA